jgi:hypothetical protein
MPWSSHQGLSLTEQLYSIFMTPQADTAFALSLEAISQKSNHLLEAKRHKALVSHHRFAFEDARSIHSHALTVVVFSIGDPSLKSHRVSSFSMTFDHRKMFPSMLWIWSGQRKAQYDQVHAHGKTWIDTSVRSSRTGMY